MALPRPSVRRFLGLLAQCVPSRLPRIVANATEYLAWCIQARGFREVGAGSYLRRPARIHNPQYIRVCEGVSSEPGLILEAIDQFEGERFEPRVTLGRGVSLGYNCHIGCINEVTIGEETLIASHVFISDHSHGDVATGPADLAPARRPLFSRGPVHIGTRVWIGEGVCILAGVTIGDNAVIGANAVVTRDVPPNAVCAGVPARPISSQASRLPFSL